MTHKVMAGSLPQIARCAKPPSHNVGRPRSVAAGNPLVEMRCLGTDLGVIAVSGVDGRLGGQGQQPLPDRGDDRVEVRVRATGGGRIGANVTFVRSTRTNVT